MGKKKTFEAEMKTNEIKTKAPEKASENGDLQTLLPIPDIFANKQKRKPVGIKKANSYVLNETPCKTLIRENHLKKQEKKKRKKKVQQKVKEVKKEMAAEERKRKRDYGVVKVKKVTGRCERLNKQRRSKGKTNQINSRKMVKFGVSE